MSQARLFSIRVAAMLLAVFVFATVQNANAAVQLRFEHVECAPLTITDNDASDQDPVPGRILYTGKTYCIFNVSVAVGLSKPNSPNSSNQALINLNLSATTTNLGG